MALEEHIETSFIKYPCQEHEKFLKTALPRGNQALEQVENAIVPKAKVFFDCFIKIYFFGNHCNLIHVSPNMCVCVAW